MQGPNVLIPAPTLQVLHRTDESLPVPEPQPLTYAEANAKLRAGAHSYSFRATNGRFGRVDIVSLGTKTPSEDRWDVRVVAGPEESDTIYVGLFDGHNGVETSELLSQTLIPHVASALTKLDLTNSTPDQVENAIQDSFISLDSHILKTAQAALAAGHPAGSAEVRAALAPAYAGSCALLLTYDPSTSTLRVAGTGDSRAILGKWHPDSNQFLSDVLSQDHNIHNKAEYDRIAAAHPGEAEDIMDFTTGDFLDIAITRVFGGFRWKWPASLVLQARSNAHYPKPLRNAKTPPYMTACPDVTTKLVSTSDFVILGSDGLWEAISNEDAVECVTRWLVARRSGAPESVPESFESAYDVNPDGSLSRTARPQDFLIEDLDNAALCLLKNVLGGRHKYMVAGAVAATPPISRYVRDDLTVQVVFFQAV